MSIIATEQKKSLNTKLQNWLYYIAHDFDRVRLSAPPRSLHTDKETGKRYAELLDDADWQFIGHVPRPESTMGWFFHHLLHGIAMRYPLRSVLAFSILHAMPNRNQVSNMKSNRLDLWLDENDLTTITLLAKRYNASRQRILESALAQASQSEITGAIGTEKYQRFGRVPIRLDGLAKDQIDTLTRETNLSKQDILRLALKCLGQRTVDL